MRQTLYPVTDWDDAYANTPHIAGGADYPAMWAARAAAFRAGQGNARLDLAYGPCPRNRLDLFLPAQTPRGLVVFVHGGFWKAFDKSVWSHLASGPQAAGFAVAVPSYTLAPEARISEITREIAAAVAFAAREVAGEIILCGHSAGGHLVTRMICGDSPLDAAAAARVKRFLSISGLHDLRPLLQARLGAELRLDLDEARRESPALLEPRAGQRLVCWVGVDERPEFVRQNSLLAQMWRGFDSRITLVEEPGRHHFDVVEGLERADSALMKALTGI